MPIYFFQEVLPKVETFGEKDDTLQSSCHSYFKKIIIFFHSILHFVIKHGPA